MDHPWWKEAAPRDSVEVKIMGESLNGEGSISLLSRSGTVVCSLNLCQGCAGTCGQYCCLRPCWCPWQHQWSVMPLEAMLVSLSHVAAKGNVDRAMMMPMIHIAAWGYADVHIWFYHHRPNRSPWTELMPEAMLISMVNVVNAVTPNLVYVHKLSCHQSPYWCPQPMFIIYAVTWSHIDFHGLGYHWRPCGRMGSVLLPESMWLSMACAVAMAYDVCGSCFYQRLCWFCHLGP